MSAVALILWFAGAGCVFVSYARGAMGAHDCSSQPAHVSQHAVSNASHLNSDQVASVAPAAVAQSSIETIVIAGAHSCCKAKPASATQRMRRSASSAAPRAVETPATVVRSKASHSAKSSCAGRSQVDQPQPDRSVTDIASLFSGALPPSGSMNCCPLTGPLVTVATKARADDNSAAATLERTILTIFNGDVHPSPLTPPLRLPNRGHTYLRCCAFLI